MLVKWKTETMREARQLATGCYAAASAVSAPPLPPSPAPQTPNWSLLKRIICLVYMQ